MPYLATRAFGPLEYSTDAVISFPRGLPGYETAREFLLLDLPDQSPVLYLQSVDFPDLCFVTLPVRIVDPDYRLWLSPEDRAVLGPDGDWLSLAIVAGHEDEPPTANLLAPVVICSSSRRGVQAVRNDRRYSHRHPLVEGAACS